MGKAKQVKADLSNFTIRTYTCVVCGNDQVLYPYATLGRYERSTERDCICSGDCNQKYLRGDYDHGKL
jgi:hypothetical protein